MPSSAPLFTSEICQTVIDARPESILDIGVGFGHYGVLFRTYSDVFFGRYEREEWETMLVGVEAFEAYRNPNWNVYDRVTIGDISEIADVLPDFDLIFAGDVIEHLPKEQGVRVVNKLRERSKVLITQIPIGMDWAQGEAFGNEYEVHRAVWTERDFEGAKFGKREFRGKKIVLAIW